MALRKHCNGTCGHYYMHLAYEHLDELIFEHGPFQHGNDEILEKGLPRPASNPLPPVHVHTHTHTHTPSPLPPPPVEAEALYWAWPLCIPFEADDTPPTPTSPHLTPPPSSLIGNRDMDQR